MPEAEPNSSIETSGGAYIAGNVLAHTFIGRNSITSVTINVSGAELRDPSATLDLLFRKTAVTVRNGQVTAGEQAVDTPPALVDALRQYLDVAAASGTPKGEVLKPVGTIIAASESGNTGNGQGPGHNSG